MGGIGLAGLFAVVDECGAQRCGAHIVRNTEFLVRVADDFADRVSCGGREVAYVPVEHLRDPPVERDLPHITGCAGVAALETFAQFVQDGNYAGTSYGMFREVLTELLGHPRIAVLPVHDRYEH